MNATKRSIKKGQDGEDALKEWFDSQSLGFVHVNQSRETFASLFMDVVKRPDFLVLFDSIGLLAVDAKHKAIFNGWVTGSLLDNSEKIKRKAQWVSLDDEQSEIRKALAFERIFRMPFWYAFFDSSCDDDCWYWISALKALEVGIRVHNKKADLEFLNIALEDCVCIANGDDLGKLYTQRVAVREGR